MKRKQIYIAITIVSFILCVLIVLLFSNNQFIRGFIGDMIITIIIYYFIKIFVDVSPIKLSIFVIIFSYCVEVSQYFRLIEHIGLSESKIAQLIIGSTFDFKDIVAYTIGVIIAFLLEKIIIHKKLFV